MLSSILVDALHSLWSARQRTLLAAIGIVIGSGSVIAMINVGQMVQAEALSRFQKMGPDILNLGLFGNNRSITRAVVEEMTAALPGEPLAAPMIRGGASWVYARKQGNLDVIGADEGLFRIAGTQLTMGRNLHHLDGSSLFAVVGSAALRPHGEAVALQPNLSDQVQLGRVIFQIVGKLKPYGNNPLLGVNFDNAVFIPLGSVRRLKDNPGIQSVLVKAPPGVEVAALGTQAQQYLEGRRRGLKVEVQLAQQAIEAMQEQSRLLSVMLGTMASISLLVGGIGIMNVMLVSVTERREEIGLRLAVGARPAHIVALFLSESAVLTTLGGILGLGLGSAGAMLVGKYSQTPYFFSGLAALLGVGVSAIVGVFFGYYPAHLASRLNPIDALNAE